MDSNLKIEIISGIILSILVLVKYLQSYFIEYLLAPIKKWFKKDKFDGVAVASGRYINNILFELRVKTNADRSSLFLFHNGTHFNPKIINNSIWKFTCAYEICKEGISYECTNMQNLLVTNHLQLIQSLWGELDEGYAKYDCPDCRLDCEQNKNIIVIVDVEKIPYGNTKAILESQGSKKLIVSPIIISGDYVGFVSLTYSSNFTFGSQMVSIDPQTNNKGLKIICDFANKIGFQLAKRN